MNQEDLKRVVARAALGHVLPGMIVGVGTGSTVNYFIDGLAELKDKVRGTVASSKASAERLKQCGIPVLDLNEVNELPLYVDGADEADDRLRLIKGGGGALTREKIVASASSDFICIVDESKLVKALGVGPLPVEVIPMARNYVANALTALGGRPVERKAFITDNGNLILDIHGLTITDPVSLEAKLDHITGIVCNGLFARRPADLLLVGTETGVVSFP